MRLEASENFFGFVFAKADNTGLQIQERDFRRGEEDVISEGSSIPTDCLNMGAKDEHAPHRRCAAGYWPLALGENALQPRHHRRPLQKL